MVSGISTKRYPSSLMSFRGRPIQSSVVARKVIYSPVGRSLTYAAILRHGNKDEVAFAPPRRDLLMVSKPMDRRQARGLYNYAKDASSIEGIRSYFGLYPKAYVITNSESRKNFNLAESVKKKAARKESMIASMETEKRERIRQNFKMKINLSRILGRR